MNKLRLELCLRNKDFFPVHLACTLTSYNQIWVYQYTRKSFKKVYRKFCASLFKQFSFLLLLSMRIEWYIGYPPRFK